MALVRRFSGHSTSLHDRADNSEVSAAKLIFLVFSGSGVLSAKLVGFLPGRTVAAILSAPGHYDGFGIESVNLHQPRRDSARVDHRRRGRYSKWHCPALTEHLLTQKGAPWAFLVHNQSPHRCTADAKDLILAWLESVVGRRRASINSASLRRVDAAGAWLSSFDLQKSEVKDSFGLTTFNVRVARITPVGANSAMDQRDAGWLPDQV